MWSPGAKPSAGMSSHTVAPCVVGVEVRDDQDGVVSSVVGSGQPFGVADDFRLVGVVEPQVAQLLERGMAAPQGVEFADQRGDGDPGGLRCLPVAGLVLVLLRVKVLFAAGFERAVLAQLVPGVHAPRGGERGGEDRPDFEGRTSPVLQVGVEDVGRVDEEVRAHVRGRFAGELGEVLLQLLLGVAPGEVRVGLVESDLGEGVHHRGPGERFG